MENVFKKVCVGWGEVRSIPQVKRENEKYGIVMKCFQQVLDLVFRIRARSYALSLVYPRINRSNNIFVCI